MIKTNRRDFMKIAGATGAVAALPASIQKALAIPAHNRTGSIEDVEHIVILMQENRSFDHHFGTLRGVRGFEDPRAVKLATGKSVWHQPNGTGEVLPYRPPVDSVGLTFFPDPPHGWNDTHAAWNQGRHDQWIPNKGVVAMTYHTRSDLPYHYALADAFTVCDAYHCSIMGPTDPNRYHLWTGWVGNDGTNGGPVITNAELGYDWSSFPERLERAGISWKIYQDIGLGLDAAGVWGFTSDAYIGNYGDNALLYFHQYQNAPAGSPLAEKAKTGTNIAKQDRDPTRLVDIFREDVRTGNLPQVSWIVAPEAYTEHPNWPANYGAWYISQFLDALVANPDVFSKTVLIINYDEEGGFFDHQVPPTPPQTSEHGLSTVAITNEIFPGDATHPSAPYGLGMRVPMIIVSPWTKGGWVDSEVFDHTSVIRFIEARYGKDFPGLFESNITPWRRAVCGDLISAFNFQRPNAELPPLPDTSPFLPINKVVHEDFKPVPPAEQAVPKQEPGIRRARALPYALHAYGSAHEDQGNFEIEFLNVGLATAVFQVRSGLASDLPRTYTVEPGEKLSDSWDVVEAYDLSVYGPNGFFRGFQGAFGGRRSYLDIRTHYKDRGRGIAFTVINRASFVTTVIVLNKYSGKGKRWVLKPHERISKQWSLEHQFGWYDFVFTTNEDPDFAYQYAGHVESGRDSISDPFIGLGSKGDAHPLDDLENSVKAEY